MALGVALRLADAQWPWPADRQTAPAHITAELYSAMVLVAVLTCVAAPLLLQRLLERWPQTE